MLGRVRDYTPDLRFSISHVLLSPFTALFNAWPKQLCLRIASLKIYYFISKNIYYGNIKIAVSNQEVSNNSNGEHVNITIGKDG